VSTSGRGRRAAGATLTLVVCATGVVWLLRAGLDVAGPEPGTAPDSLVLVTIDTLRMDHLGIHGGPTPTPHLDALARDGVVLMSAVTPTPSTAPAHASLFTGLHPWRHGVLDNAVRLDTAEPTLAEILGGPKRATAAFVASYILHPRFGLGRGFAQYRFEASEPYTWRGRERERFWSRGNQVTDRALRWLEAEGERPFLLWVHYFDPHAPYQPPAAFEQPTEEAVAPASTRLPAHLPDARSLAELIRGYRGEIAYTDAQVGRLLDGLEALNLRDRTAVLVTSDHGEGLGDHGLLEHGENLFSELVRVPVILRSRGLPAGRRLHGAAQLEDLMPTLLALLGEPIPLDLDGRNLLPWLRGEVAESPREWAVGRRKPFPGEPDLYFAQRGSEKWIGALGAPGNRFRLDTDPGEHTPETHALPPPELLRRVATVTPRPGIPEPLDDETLRALEALGYGVPRSDGSPR